MSDVDNVTRGKEALEGSNFLEYPTSNTNFNTVILCVLGGDQRYIAMTSICDQPALNMKISYNIYLIFEKKIPY